MDPFVFLVGCARSGTTLLQRIVDAHPQIAITPELHWITDRFKDGKWMATEGRVTAELVAPPRSAGRVSVSRQSTTTRGAAAGRLNTAPGEIFRANRRALRVMAGTALLDARAFPGDPDPRPSAPSTRQLIR